MALQADVLVFELFDCGLLGEGCLHALASAKRFLLKGDARIVPERATVWAVPLFFGVQAMNGIELRTLNRYWWNPEYDAIDLKEMWQHWQALSSPFEAFTFDFHKIEGAGIGPEAKQKRVTVTKGGTMNAVAFYFELSADDERTYSTSPWCDRTGKTWPQAVQFMEEVEVVSGECLTFTVQHDTTGIQFHLDKQHFERSSRRCTTLSTCH